MDFNLIISNPPYGKIGANITKEIIDYVNYDEFINLLPANDYKRNTTADLYNYQSDMEAINDGFADAAVTTHVARIHKDKVNNMTLDEFERSNYIDRQLDKYFVEQGTTRRTETAAHKYYFNGGILTEAKANKNDLFSKTAILIGLRDINHRHLPYSRKIFNYKWNTSYDLSIADLIPNVGKGKGMYGIGWIDFRTKVEKENFVTFIYSNSGFRFLSKLFTSINCDSTVTYDKVFPKVDWTRSWTVEEILADYGYTETEIKAIMDGLNNFKGMEG